MKWTFRNVFAVLGVLAGVGLFVIWMAMGIEIFTDMDPDVIIAESYAMGICLVVFFSWLIYFKWSKRIK